MRLSSLQFSQGYSSIAHEMLKVVPTAGELSNPVPKNTEVCSKCNKAFLGKSALKTHLRRKHGINKEDCDIEKKYYCPVVDCGHGLSGSIPFSSYAAVKQHFKLVHGSDRFICSRCEKQFKTKHSCKQHESECGMKYLCSCNVEYTTKRGLLEHVKRQNHKIPVALRSIFDSKKKTSNEKLSCRAVSSSKLILPKTWQKKVRLFHVNSNNVIVITKNLKEVSQPRPKQVTVQTPIAPLPTINTHCFENSNLRNSNSVSVQFPVLQNGSLSKENDQSSRCPTAIPETDSWFQRNISIQTEANSGIGDWINIDEEVDKILSENIATQTIESIFERNPIETDSTMSQTDWRHNAVSDFNNMMYSNYNNVYSQPATFCDAQNQTVIDGARPCVNIPVQTLPLTSQQSDGIFAMPGSDFVCAESISTSIETQTERSMSLSTIETQTNHFLLNGFQGQSTCGHQRIPSLEALLNSETQTDIFMPAWSENPAGSYVNSCTQTPDADFLSEILDIN